MKKRWLFLLIIVACIEISKATYRFFEEKASQEYVDSGLPFYAQDKTTNKMLYAESPKKIAESMIAGEESFRGDLKVNYLDYDKAEIKMTNDAIGDDSIGAVEYYVIAERKQPGWKITQFKTHWKCGRGLYWPKFWTTGSCP